MARGAKTGGRKKGSINKATAEMREKIAKSGITPLEFMLKILRDEKQPLDFRMVAAEKAAPYVHAKLSAVELSGNADNPLSIVIQRFADAQH